MGSCYQSDRKQKYLANTLPPIQKKFPAYESREASIGVHLPFPYSLFEYLHQEKVKSDRLIYFSIAQSLTAQIKNFPVPTAGKF